MPVSGRNKVIGETSLYMPPRVEHIPLILRQPEQPEPVSVSRWTKIKLFVKKILFYKIF